MGETRWLQVIQSWLQVLTVVVGALWAVYACVDHASKEAEATARTRLIEAQQPFLRKQLDLYFETAELAGRLVTEDATNPKYKDDVIPTRADPHALDALAQSRRPMDMMIQGWSMRRFQA